MSRPDGTLLVIGVGNVLLRDEGVGVRVARELHRLGSSGRIALPPGTRVIDGGTLGLDLLPLLEDARALLLIDAVDLGRAPGAVDVIPGDALREALSGHASPDQVGIGDLLAGARLLGTLPEAVALIAIQPGEIAVGLELTDAVEEAVPVAVQAAVDELRSLAAAAGGAGPVADRSVATAGTG